MKDTIGCCGLDCEEEEGRTNGVKTEKITEENAMKKIFIHGSGHRAESWKATLSCMKNSGDVLCPDLSSILKGKEAAYENLYAAFIEYCGRIDGRIHLCGLSLGGILALNYALDFPEKVKTLVLIGAPSKVPKVMFCIQNIIFRFLPESVFQNMAFNKRDTFLLGNTMKNLDFSEKVKNIKCPALIICGKKDSANMKSALYFSRNMKNAKLKIIQNTGHVLNEENPRDLGRLLDKFYSRTDI